MAEYIDLVICKHEDDSYGRQMLCCAPAWAILESGDHVLVEGIDRAYEVIVVNKLTVDPTSDIYQFILDAANFKTPLKRLLKKIEYREFEYEEDKHEQSNNNQ